MKDLMLDLIEQLFHSRNLAHLAHLKTESYAAHIALGEYYEEIVPLTDSLAEALQSKIGLINVTIPTADGRSVEEMIEYLGDLSDFIQTVKPNSVGLQNIIDDIDTLVLETVYKLKFLS